MKPAELRPSILLFYDVTEEFWSNLPHSDQHLELIDGHVVLTLRPPLVHQHLLLQLATVLLPWVELHKLGEVIHRPEVRLSEKWHPVPDLMFLARERKSLMGEQYIDGPPDLMVELLCEHSEWLDRGRKFREYALAGVSWYWIIDIDRAMIEEYEGANGRFVNLVHTPFDQPFAPRLFPGLTIDLASLR